MHIYRLHKPEISLRLQSMKHFTLYDTVNEAISLACCVFGLLRSLFYSGFVAWNRKVSFISANRFVRTILFSEPNSNVIHWLIVLSLQTSGVWHLIVCLCVQIHCIPPLYVKMRCTGNAKRVIHQQKNWVNNQNRFKRTTALENHTIT